MTNSHNWILEVLSDVSAYAAENGLSEIADSTLISLRIAAAELLLKATFKESVDVQTPLAKSQH